MLYRALSREQREIAVARCYVFGEAYCTLPRVYATKEPESDMDLP